MIDKLIFLPIKTFKELEIYNNYPERLSFCNVLILTYSN